MEKTIIISKQGEVGLMLTQELRKAEAALKESKAVLVSIGGVCNNANISGGVPLLNRILMLQSGLVQDRVSAENAYDKKDIENKKFADVLQSYAFEIKGNEHTLERIEAICKKAGIDTSVEDHRGMVGKLKGLYDEYYNKNQTIREALRKAGFVLPLNSVPLVCEVIRGNERKVEQINSLKKERNEAQRERDNLAKRSDHFEAKASKLNAEKLALLKIAETHMVGTAYDEFLTEYKAWQTKRGAK